MGTEDDPMDMTPMLLGRRADEKVEERAGTVLGVEMRVPFTGGAEGVAKVQLYFSQDDEDRGGVVMRVTIEQGDCVYLPTCRPVDGGVELHVAGDYEAQAFLSGLGGVLAAATTAPDLVGKTMWPRPA